VSTIYNRRRGSAAHRPRKLRQCRACVVSHLCESNGWQDCERCPAVAPINRYCPEHQRGRAS
jgi:hypothetical protein